MGNESATRFVLSMADRGNWRAAAAEFIPPHSGGIGMTRYLAFASCLLAVGCADPAGNGPAAQAQDTLDVYETVFRHRLLKQPGDVKREDVKAYLSVDGQ